MLSCLFWSRRLFANLKSEKNSPSLVTCKQRLFQPVHSHVLYSPLYSPMTRNPLRVDYFQRPKCRGGAHDCWSGSGHKTRPENFIPLLSKRCPHRLRYYAQPTSSPGNDWQIHIWGRTHCSSYKHLQTMELLLIIQLWRSQLSTRSSGEKPRRKESLTSGGWATTEGWRYLYHTFSQWGRVISR